MTLDNYRDAARARDRLAHIDAHARNHHAALWDCAEVLADAIARIDRSRVDPNKKFAQSPEDAALEQRARAALRALAGLESRHPGKVEWRVADVCDFGIAALQGDGDARLRELRDWLHREWIGCIEAKKAYAVNTTELRECQAEANAIQRACFEADRLLATPEPAAAPKPEPVAAPSASEPEPATQVNDSVFDRLLCEVANAHFECGAWTKDDDEDYSELSWIAYAAGDAVTAYVRDLAARAAEADRLCAEVETLRANQSIRDAERDGRTIADLRAKLEAAEKRINGLVDRGLLFMRDAGARGDEGADACARRILRDRDEARQKLAAAEADRNAVRNLLRDAVAYYESMMRSKDFAGDARATGAQFVIDTARHILRGDDHPHPPEAKPDAAVGAVVSSRPMETTNSSFPILEHFKYEHLPPALQEVSKPFCDLARDMVMRAPHGGAELAAGLRKLLEAKDCCVRAVRVSG